VAPDPTTLERPGRHPIPGRAIAGRGAHLRPQHLPPRVRGLDAAERYAVTSLRRWDGGRLISRTKSGLLRATIEVTAGEPHGLPLAHQTLIDAGKLRSARTRREWVLPLAQALEGRRGADYTDLARMARKVAAA
jgi:hypothetical protein